MAKKTLTVTLHMSELIYNVLNTTFLTGRSRNNGNNHEEAANMQANEDEENLNQIVRSIGNAFSTLKTKLSEYISSDGTSASNVLIDESANLSLTLLMPANYKQSTSESIASAAHQYLVNIAIGDWFTITNKDDAAYYMALAASNLQEIREAINKRVRPQRENVDQ
ncbi:MAG: hypothetical protein IKJ09_00730 [Bacteroidaceae bacterium]|nr:hypothetical protein [Bacteroidaceae bacterium]